MHLCGRWFWLQARENVLLHGDEDAVRTALREAAAFEDGSDGSGECSFRANLFLLFLWDDPVSRFDHLVGSRGPGYPDNGSHQTLLSTNLDYVLEFNAVKHIKEAGDTALDNQVLVHKILEASRTDIQEVRRLAALALGIAAYYDPQTVANQDALGTMEALLRDPDSSVRQTACVSAKYFMPNSELADLLKGMVEGDSTSGVRIMALDSLARTHAYVDISSLVKAALDSRDPSVRRYALQSAAESMPPLPAIRTILSKITDAEPGVRAAVPEVLWWMAPLWLKSTMVITIFFLLVLVIEAARLKSVSKKSGS